jgi:predicted enzyme related to lactoylglutathione lyase
MKNQIVWVDIPVVRLERAIAFYSEILNGEVKKESGHADIVFGLLPHGEDNVSGCLFTTSDNKPSQTGPLIYLNTEGRLNSVVEIVKKHGGKILQEIHPIGKFGYRIIIIDTEGNRIALHSFAA